MPQTLQEPDELDEDSAFYSFTQDGASGYGYFIRQPLVMATSGMLVSFTDSPLASIQYLYGTRIDPEEDIFIIKHLRMMLVEEEEGYLATNEELGIIAYGADARLAMRDFLNLLFDTWMAYANEPDENLTEDAIQLRNKLLSYIGR